MEQLERAVLLVDDFSVEFFLSLEATYTVMVMPRSKGQFEAI